MFTSPKLKTPSRDPESLCPLLKKVLQKRRRQKNGMCNSQAEAKPSPIATQVLSRKSSEVSSSKFKVQEHERELSLLVQAPLKRLKVEGLPRLNTLCFGRSGTGCKPPGARVSGGLGAVGRLGVLVGDGFMCSMASWRDLYAHAACLGSIVLAATSCWPNVIAWSILQQPKQPLSACLYGSVGSNWGQERVKSVGYFSAMATAAVEKNTKET